MIPQYKTEFIEVAYWTCPVETHRHKTRDVADRCVQKCYSQKAERRKWTPEMIANIFTKALDGATLKEAGAIYNVSPERARQVMAKAARIMRHPSRLDEPYPDCNRTLAEWRSHREFWIRQLAKFVVHNA